jgi:hypothetical protein
MTIHVVDLVRARSGYGSGAQRRLCAVTLLVLLLGLVTPAWAQKDTGSIVGTVKDPTGAVILGFNGTVTEVDKGISFVASTSASGEYVASPLGSSPLSETELCQRDPEARFS